ncbi:PREDICTED: ankyrin repeat domain-containing protein 39-like [Priapulus caudatus]|uniref:Ankyrin repeat domain-containing protein 39-like n=1 Tax=Priapulus caudatus TaxID=37621 RepID=A0ABM1FAZ6_PRICU|nr:PREDICTED: ankyrin repeat domain-containing protein 39-like [Priapulus caudatus]XP_014681618.1 PREDICTED: ankyrin repeat domain-containing protein 39-like [Priapulus caudatus]XP_014681619.1 PREDICTED: ankyrin repeat domain-containing protein 39-like [Priapulus caudatus]
MNHSHDASHCSTHQMPNPSVMQTMPEMEFERGVWSAALSGEVGKVNNYLAKGGDANAVDSSGYTALHYASRSGHRAVIAILLQHGANPNIQTRAGGATAMHRAAYCGHSKVILDLLQAKADPTLQDKDGKTALHKAAEMSQKEAFEVLLKTNKHLLNIKDNNGKAPVDYIKEHKAHLEHCKEILQNL